MTTPCRAAGPLAVSKRSGIWWRKRWMIWSRSTPITPSVGPVSPRSVMYAVPPGSTRSSAVCTWRCVPTTALTRPSRYQPIASDSLVASACMSTRMIGVSFRSSGKIASAARKGQSIGSMNTRPMRLSTATLCGPHFTVTWPTPGAPGGDVRRAQEQVLLRDVLDDLLLVPDVVARGQHVGAGLEDLARDQRGDAEAARGVLDVDDGEVDRVLLAEPRQELRDRLAPGLA